MYLRCYQYLNYLSLDVAFGAVISALFLSVILSVRTPVCVYIVLALTIWCIYTFDHLLDAKKTEGQLSSSRHLFHKKHYIILSNLLIAALCIDGLLVFFLPFNTLVSGAFLGCMVLVYFLSIHLLNRKAIIHKELMIALIYTAGVFLGPVSIFEHRLEVYHIIMFTAFFMIVLLNLLIFSLFDIEADKKAQFPSLIQIMGIRNSEYLIMALSFVSVGLIVLVGALGLYEESLMLLSMFLVLQLIFWFRENKVLAVNYRYLGDGIFLLPILYLL